MTSRRYQTDLTDAQWALLQPRMPAPARTSRPRADLREVANGILYLAAPAASGGCSRSASRRGARSTPVPPMAGRRHPPTVQDALRRDCRRAAGRDESPASSAVDSQSVKAAGQGGERGFDAGKRVAGRKRHLWVDSLGL